MDFLAEKGRVGLLQITTKNIAIETDSGAFSILGYDIEKYYTGRGPLEAYGAGLKFNEGDIAFRVNLATRSGEKIIDRRVCRDISDREAEVLVEDINNGFKLTSVPAEFELKSLGGGYRCSLVIRKQGGILSGNITNTDPAYRKEGYFSIPEESYEMIVQECKPLDESKEAMEAAMLTNEFSAKASKLLQEHQVNKERVKKGKQPANLILIRDCGDRLPILAPLNRKFKAKFGFAAEVCVERGIALLAESDLVEIGRYSKDYESDYPKYAKIILESMKNLDVICIHLKGPDDLGHDGEVIKKKESIEAIDKFFFGKLLPHVNLKDTIITITSDHSTPCELKTHSNDPVPLLISCSDIKHDNTKSFNELSCANGSLKPMYGIELMPLLIKVANGHEIPETYLK